MKAARYNRGGASPLQVGLPRGLFPANFFCSTQFCSHSPQKVFIWPLVLGLVAHTCPRWWVHQPVFSASASFRLGCSIPGRLFIVFSPLPRTLQSVAPGSPPDDPVRGLVPCFIPPRMLQSGASFYRILSVASDALVRGTGFTPGRSSPGASAVLHSALDAPIRGVFLSYSLR